MKWRNRTLIASLSLVLLPGAAKWPPRAAADQVSAQPADQNKALYDFLGQPVAPPANLDPAYTKEGLPQAVQLAAKNAGIAVKKIEIDDSEFPFLVGVVCEKGDRDKLVDEIKKMPKYAYGGGEGDDTIGAMNIIPYTVYIGPDFYHIHRRMSVRMDMLYDKITAKSSPDAAQPHDQKASPGPATQPSGGGAL
jgi:hypothetical protein